MDLFKNNYNTRQKIVTSQHSFMDILNSEAGGVWGRGQF